MTDQLGDKMRPDSQKTTTEKVGDTASGMGDRVARAVQPEYVINCPAVVSTINVTDTRDSSQKSTTQKMGDTMRSGSDSASGQSKGMAQSVSDMASNAAQGVKDTMSSAMGTDNSGATERK